jgi:hypothetical protein
VCAVGVLGEVGLSGEPRFLVCGRVSEALMVLRGWLLRASFSIPGLGRC